MFTRATGRSIIEYTDRAIRGDLVEDDPPDGAVLEGISRLLDSKCAEVFRDFEEGLQQTREIRLGVETLRVRRTCGGFRVENGILADLTAYEQMSTVRLWMEENGANIRGQHTYAFLDRGDDHEDRIVPIWVKKPQHSPATLMTTIVGTTSGVLKAPSYDDWARENPWDTPLSHFVDPLNSLEMQRQPNYLASALLRANPFDAEVLDEGWRYATEDGGDLLQTASVEHKRQQTRRVREIKRRSAAFNLDRMLSGALRETNLLVDLHYEDVAPDGYDDDAEASVTPVRIARAVRKAVRDGDHGDVESVCRELFTTRLSTDSQVPVVRNYVQETFFPDGE